MAWPALLNGYPIVFSDTAGLGEMGLLPTMGWDKPWVYGPLIVLFHWGRTLWGVVVAQTILLSAMLWLTGEATRMGGRLRHVAVCGVLAVASAAPWFATFVMPDIFAPLTVLGVFVLAWGRCLPRAVTVAVGAVTAVAIASHLTHLIIAAACLAAILLIRPRRVFIATVPLLAALAWLLGSNAVGNGIIGISPYGSVFALARLQADGPAADYLHSICPDPAYHFCGYAAGLPMDSDAFLWEPKGPIWGNDSGPTLVAAEASRIVSATIRYEPLQVARDAMLNALRQLFQADVGDTLAPSHLEVTVGLLLRTYFPAAELSRFEAARQVNGDLPALAQPLAALRTVVLALGAAGSMALIVLGWRNHPALAALALTVIAGVAGNAFATGALSGPHDRYGARIAWLVIVPPMMALLNVRLPRGVGAAGGHDGQPRHQEPSP